MSNDETRDLVVQAPNGVQISDAAAGTLVLAQMSEQEFTTKLATLKKGRERIATIQRELMEPDIDYGVIPGTPKPTLLKPGAEKLGDFYHLAADFGDCRDVGDGVTSPTILHTVHCSLHLGDLGGPVVAVGMGSASSWERKHRYRVAELACPKCGVVGTVLKSKNGGWFCWAKKGGCGAQFPDEDTSIKNQPRGQMENPDPWDLDNTILKMAEKRSYVDATLRATATSGLFTQDVEDFPEPERRPEPPQQQQPTPNGRNDIAASTHQERPSESKAPEQMPNELAEVGPWFVTARDSLKELPWAPEVIQRSATSLAISLGKGNLMSEAQRHQMYKLLTGKEHGAEMEPRELYLLNNNSSAQHVKRWLVWLAWAEDQVQGGLE